jgi:hypothetical protein
MNINIIHLMQETCSSEVLEIVTWISFRRREGENLSRHPLKTAILRFG